MKKVCKILIPILALALVSGLVYVSCGKDKATTSPGPSTEWTILSYGAGNNSLDYQQGGNSYTIQDVQDMEKVGSTDKVQIVAMVSSIRTGGVAKYYHVEHYPDDLGDNLSSTVLVNKGTTDMSDPQTLKDFIVYGITNYPAKKYMLIIDDHGGGWRGACSDEQNGSGSVMSMVDMNNAIHQGLAQVNVGKFNVTVFHACLMSMVEVAYELRNSTDYMVASEFSMPMESVLGANEWLGTLVAAPTTGGSDLARAVAVAVYNAGNYKQKYVHMAAADMSKMQRLAAKISDLGTQIRTSAVPYFDEVLDAWLRTNVTVFDDSSNVDIRDFALKLKQEPTLQNINLVRDACDSLIAALNSAILITNTNAPGISRGGFTIYLPYLRYLYESSNYSRMQFNDVQWNNFVEFFITTIEQIGNQQVSISGNIYWDGHQLTHPIAFLDTSHTDAIIGILPTPADANGAFTIQFQLQGNLEAYVEGFDDLNNDGNISSGEPYGWWDANGDGQWNDMLTLQPGQTINGANVVIDQFRALNNLRKPGYISFKE